MYHVVIFPRISKNLECRGVSACMLTYIKPHYNAIDNVENHLAVRMYIAAGDFRLVVSPILIIVRINKCFPPYLDAIGGVTRRLRRRKIL